MTNITISHIFINNYIPWIRRKVNYTEGLNGGIAENASYDAIITSVVGVEEHIPKLIYKYTTYTMIRLKSLGNIPILTL